MELLNEFSLADQRFVMASLVVEVMVRKASSTLLWTSILVLCGLNYYLQVIMKKTAIGCTAMEFV